MILVKRIIPKNISAPQNLSRTLSDDDRILLPKSDLIFKRIFGAQKNADILRGFLESVLDLPPSEYKKLTIVDPHLQIEDPADKYGILDVKLNTLSGKSIDIEIQLLDTYEMRERIIWYLSKMVTEQVSKSDDYIVLKKVISILITDFRLIEENEDYHNCYHLYNPKNGSEFTDLIEVNTLELPKLPCIKDDTKLWEWLKFLTSTHKEEFTMLAQNNPDIEKAVGVLMELSADEQTRLLYESREKARWDEMARMRGSKAEGRAEGEKKKAIEVARKLLQRGIQTDIIVETTGLPPEKIANLGKE
jgi:predicted transposase/invertase (TIGR01784 family)